MLVCVRVTVTVVVVARSGLSELLKIIIIIIKIARQTSQLCVCVCVTVCLNICNERSLHQMASTECSANVRFSFFRLHYQSGGGFVGWDGSTRSKQQQRGMLGCVPAEVLFSSRSRSKNSKFCRHNPKTFWVSRSWFSGPARSSCGTDGRHAAHPYRRNCIADN